MGLITILICAASGSPSNKAGLAVSKLKITNAVEILLI